MEYIASGAQADIYKDGNKAIKLFKNCVSKNDIVRAGVAATIFS